MQPPPSGQGILGGLPTGRPSTQGTGLGMGLPMETGGQPWDLALAGPTRTAGNAEITPLEVNFAFQLLPEHLHPIGRTRLSVRGNTWVRVHMCMRMCAGLCKCGIYGCSYNKLSCALIHLLLLTAVLPVYCQSFPVSRS